MRAYGVTFLADIFAGIALLSSAPCATPDDVMRAAGYDVDQATSSTPEWELRGEGMRPCYEITYNFPGQTMFLRVDPQTSETMEISGQYGRGSNPSSGTATLTHAWATTVLLRLNPYKIVHGSIHMAEPTITYYPDTCKYVIRFPRTDAAGHRFLDNAAGFDFDPATSRVTGLLVSVSLPEPPVTTGTMISPEQATSIVLQGLMTRRASIFQRVPDKMTFDYIPESITIGVEERNNFFGGGTSGTAVVYRILRFESRLAEQSYKGFYEKVKATAYVAVFTGELVAGYYTKMYTFRE